LDAKELLALTKSSKYVKEVVTECKIMNKTVDLIDISIKMKGPCEDKVFASQKVVLQKAIILVNSFKYQKRTINN
jgi:hypothetical protein